MNLLDLTLPLKVTLPRKTKANKNIYINLNTYRNLHYISSNQAKQIFKEDLKDSLRGLVFSSPIKIIYTYYANSNRKSDLSNMCSIVDKFFCDALTEYGCIEDDNYEFVKEVNYVYGGVDRGKGRVEVKLMEYFKDETG